MWEVEAVEGEGTGEEDGADVPVWWVVGGVVGPGGGGGGGGAARGEGVVEGCSEEADVCLDWEVRQVDE